MFGRFFVDKEFIQFVVILIRNKDLWKVFIDKLYVILYVWEN